MISRQDILDRAGEWHLRPEVVEKDYVLGWLLAGLSSMPAIRDAWVFKGGTCIKKCYFETYRFSEDLDFSITPDAPYSQEQIRQLVIQAMTVSSEASGLHLPPDGVTLFERRNRQGLPTFEARLSYRGPLQAVGALPRIRLDLTQHEPIIDDPVERTPFHPYPDHLPDTTTVATYTLDELLAEKTRALFERTRPRDLYDVVFLVENARDQFNLAHARELLHRKCASKELAPPTSRDFVAHVRQEEELVSEWANMLAHQLPVLPELSTYLDRLPGLIEWLDAPMAAAVPGVALGAIVVSAGEEPILATGVRYWNVGVPLEALRFAGSNRLLVDFEYHGKSRRVEPYSLRRARTGNLLFYGWELASGQIKAFKVPEMQNLRATGTAFSPRFRLELSEAIPVSTPVAQSRPRSTSSRRTSGFRQASRQFFLYECPVCRRQFKRTHRDAALRPHKNNFGEKCSGRRGVLVSSRW